MHGNNELINTLAMGFTAAFVLGFLTHRIGLSPLVGYLLAGVVVGPKTPGFTADSQIAQQFAEVGVILLMFGVGLEFHPKQLLAVKKIAVPGAVGQITVATVLGAVVAVVLGEPLGAGIVLGLAVSVASTVVLIRVLMDNNMLQTVHGHIAVGWLIVEDIFTVLVLVALPTLAKVLTTDDGSSAAVLSSMGIAVVKVAALVGLVWVVGKRTVPWLLQRVAGTRSRELFVLAVLALALAIATGSSMIFGVSMALGAFLAGMMVGQSELSYQAAADALPMRNAFAVLFFVSVGMLFDPDTILEQPVLLVAVLGIVLVAKPLAALLIVWVLGYSVTTALTVAVALSQIGEFSFILAQVATEHKLLSAADQSILVTCAIVSITLNPILFRTIGPIERWLRGNDRLWRMLSARSEAGGRARRGQVGATLTAPSDKPRAIIVGYGPVGQTVTRILKEFGVEPVVIDINLDTVRMLNATGIVAIYGDASRRDILEAADTANARYLLVTVPDINTRTLILIVAQTLNPKIKMYTRARYLQEREWLEELGVTEACYEEMEAAVGLATLILREVGADGERIAAESQCIRGELAMQKQDSKDREAELGQQRED